MKIFDVIKQLEVLAPPFLQEQYDNAGLITGNASWDCKGVLVTLDAVELVVEEAVAKNCNLIVAHHPIVFKGLKSVTGKNYIERTVIKAIKNDVAIYAIHTNLDNVIGGVNKMIADKIGLAQQKILQPKEGFLRKLITFSPVTSAEAVRSALFTAGAGEVGKYDQCSFNTTGVGTFRGGSTSNPYVGTVGVRHSEPEEKIEVIFPVYLQNSIMQALLAAHPYEEVAYDLVPLANTFLEVGSGLVGTLATPMEEAEFLMHVKNCFGLKLIRHTALTGKRVKTVAVCGGAGIFLLGAAKANGADVYLTADVKYHEFFDADGTLLLADIGHYESEQFTSDLLFDYLHEKFPNFAVLKTGVNTNPVQYS